MNSAPLPVITSASGDFNICAPGSDKYTVTYTGSPAPTYTWSYTGGTGVTFATTTSNPTTATFSSNATTGTLTLRATNTCGNNTVTQLITVNAITTQPTDQSISAGGGSVNFTAAATAGSATGYQWQYSANGTTGWINVADGTPAGFSYSNETTSILSVLPDETSTVSSNYFYRCIITTNTGCALTSNSARLTVRPVNDLCADAIELVVDDPAIQGTLTNATYSAPPTLNPSNLNDVWYKFTPDCSFTHTITIAGFSTSQVRASLYSGSCTNLTSVTTSTASGTTQAVFTDVNLTSGITYYVRVYAFSGTPSGFNIRLTQTAPSFTLTKTTTPPTRDVLTGTTDVEVFGFQLAPNGCSSTFDLTALRIGGAGTANASDLSNFRIVYDANGNGIMDGSEISISGAGIPWAATMNFAITGQTGISSARKYLLIADVNINATQNRTFIGSLTAANTTAGVAVTGTTVTGNTQTIRGPQIVISGSHPAPGTIDQNTNNNILAIFKMVDSYVAATPTGLTLTTSGTYTAGSDVSQFRLYQNSAANLGGAPVLLGTAIATASGTQLNFTFTGTPIALNGTSYFILTADIPNTALDGKTVNITSPPISAFVFTSTAPVLVTGTPGSPTNPGKTIRGPRVTITEAHPPAGGMALASTDNPIASYKLDAANTNITPTAFSVTTAGTYTTNDITAFSLYQNATNDLNGTPVLIGTITAITGQPMVLNFSGFSANFTTIPSGGTSYLIVTADVDYNATVNRYVSITNTPFTQFSFNSSGPFNGSLMIAGADPVPAGNRQTIQGSQVTISAAHPATGTISQNTIDNPIASFKIVAAFGAATPNGISFTTAGTYLAGTDISQFSLYQNVTNNLLGAPTLIGTFTATASGTTIAITGTGATMAAGETNYLIITADVPTSAIDGNNVRVSTTGISAFDFTDPNGDPVNLVQGSPNPGGNSNYQTISGPRVRIATVHPPTGNISRGSADNRVGVYQLDVSNSAVNVNPTSVSLTTAGSFAAGDLTNFKLYQNSANTLAGATLVGTINASAMASGAVLTFNSGFDNIPNSGTSFLILTTDVDPAAVLGRQIRIASVNNAQFDFISSDGGRVVKLGTNPLAQSNLQTIVGPTATIYTVHPAPANMAVGSGGNLIASYRIAAGNSDITPNSITFTTAGTYRGAGDVINFNLYQNNANSLTGATLVGTIASAGVVSGETLTFTSGSFLSIPSGSDGFLLLTVDISGGATATRTLSITPTNRTNFIFTSTAVVDVLGTNPAVASNVHTIVPFVSVYWSGTNTWNSTLQIWSRVSGGPYNQNVWIVNGIANLEGTGGTISIGQAVSAQRINNNKGGAGLAYTINSNASTYGIYLSSPAIVDIASRTTTIGAANNNAVFYGLNGLTKIGNGELAIQSPFANTFSGPVNVNAGELTLGTKASGTSNPLNYLNGNDIVLNNGKLTIAASSGANASLNDLTAFTSTGNSTVSLYQTARTGWLAVNPTINTGTFNAANATPLSVSGQLTIDDGGSSSFTTGTYDNGSQNYIAFGTTTYTGNTVFKGFATSNSILRGAGTHVNINLGGYGHYLSGVLQAAGTINDNGFSTTFLGGGNGSNHAAELCFNSSSSAMTGNWIIGDAAGKDAGWIVTNTSTCLTRGDITVNNFSKLALQLTNAGNASISYAPTTIRLSGLGPDLRWPSALDFFNFSYGSTVLFSNLIVNPVPNSRLASIGSMVGATNESSASRASFQLNGTVSGTGGLEKTGVGILILNAQNGSGFFNSYQDSTRIKMGTLIVNKGSNLGSGPLVMHQATRYLESGGSNGYSTTLNLDNSAQTIASLSSVWTNTSGSYSQVINLADGHSLTINQATNTTFGNYNATTTSLLAYITGDDANLIKDGAGTLTLSGPNTYTGLTQVKNGTLELNRTNGTTIPDNNNVDIIGGTLKISKNQVLNNVTLSSGFLRVENGATLTINGTFTLVPSSSSITLVGSGKIVYGPNVTLIYAGNALQVTDASKELPATSGPRNIVFNNYSNAGVQLSSNISVGNTAGIATVNGWLDFNGKTITGPNNIGGLFTLNGLTSITLTGTATAGSNIISNIITSAIKIGMQVTGAGIPANAAVDYIDPLNPKTVRLNVAATASGSVSLDFGYRGGLMISMPNGVDGHVQVKGSKIYNAGANYIFNVPTTGNKISPAFPTVGNILNYSPAWNVTFNAGIKNLVVMNAGRDLKIDHDLTMTTGIFVTNNNLVTWSNNGGVLTAPNMPWIAHNYSYKNSFIAICDEAGVPLTTLDGSKGFRINNLGAKDTYFPIGVSFLPAGPGLDPAPNRMMLNNHGEVNNYTVVINIGDILHTPKPVVERIWYVNPQNAGNSKLTMKLFFTKRDQFNYPVGQNEVESGFDYNALQLVQEEGDVFTRIANGADSLTLASFPGSDNNVDELFGQYTVGISKDPLGNANGINDFTRYSVVNAGTIILPVKMVDFKAYPQADKVMTEWKSLVEINVDHYEVERSVDGIRFGKLYSMPAKNNGNPVQYSWPDANPEMGNNFYRIKAVDRDGSVTYTNVINVIFGNQNKPGFTIYPNPATTQYVTLKLDNIPAGRYSVMVYSVSGQLVINKTIDHPGGNGMVKLNLPGSMINGTYPVLFSDGKTQYKQLLIVGQ